MLKSGQKWGFDQIINYKQAIPSLQMLKSGQKWGSDQIISYKQAIHSLQMLKSCQKLGFDVKKGPHAYFLTFFAYICF